MAKTRISVGDDTSTGEPDNGPRGPYITQDADDEVAAAGRNKGQDGGVENRPAAAVSKKNETTKDVGGTKKPVAKPPGRRDDQPKS